ncbi:MAG TPA: hypothetical protein VGO47_10200 [Chlamydiales bacterium]|nr:hypothetical protein [Chlamydiales bacterium]
MEWSEKEGRNLCKKVAFFGGATAQMSQAAAAYLALRKPLTLTLATPKINRLRNKYLHLQCIVPLSWFFDASL